LDEATKACPRCRGIVNIRATRCKHCKEDLPSRPEPEDNTDSAAQYRFLEPLHGRGTFGPTYLAEPKESDDPARVVIKTIPESLLEPVERRAAAMQALRSVCGIEHNHIAPILDVYVADHEVHQVRAHIPGDSLRQIIDSRKHLPLEEVRALGSRLLQTLNHLHAQEPPLVHGNLHPGNILIDERGHPHILDLGFGSLANRETLKDVPGEKRVFVYMSPEQIRGEAPEPASDLYSLGVILYEGLSGHPPFPQVTDDGLECRKGHLSERPPLITVDNTPVPETVQDIIAELLAKSAEYRLPDRQKAIQELHAGTVLTPASRTETRLFMPTLQQAIAEELAKKGSGPADPDDGEKAQVRPPVAATADPATAPEQSSPAPAPKSPSTPKSGLRKRRPERVIAIMASIAVLGLVFYQWGLPVIRSWTRPGPTEVIEIVAKSFRGNDPGALYDLIPESYQQDLDDLVQMVATGIDAETYDNIVAGMRHLTKGTVKHRGAMKRLLFADTALSDLDQERLLTQIATISQIVLSSDLQSHARLKKLDLGDFLDEHGESLMTTYRQFMSVTGESKSLDDLDDMLTDYDVKTLRETEHLVVIEVSKYGNSDEWEFVQIEGKWVPKSFRKAWLKAMLDISEDLDKGLEKYDQRRAQIRAGSKLFRDAAREFDENGSTTELAVVLAGL